ncbi:MAG: hypothetical protein D3923_11295, partial [Candidatus Electrothrix sp. AR3]|nr:hypothetical protein [Candidatus Electrothrix sp. AR3]
GAFLSRAATAIGAQVTVIEPHEGRHAYHENVMRTPGADLFDVSIVAVGSVQAYREALAHLNPRGRLVVFSGLSKQEAGQMIDFNRMHYEEKTIVGAYGCSYRHGRQALEWIQSGKVPVSDLISHQMPLHELGRALELVRNRSGMKILLYP